MQLYCDLDGVLADFDVGYEALSGAKPNRDSNFDDVDWALVRNTKDFYKNLPPMPDMQKLWTYIKKYNPPILTGIPSAGVPEAEGNKRAWVYKNLGSDVTVICCLSKDKANYCTRGDVIIDDYPRYRDKWIAAGGIWILHKNAKTTIQRLQGLGL